ncbi:hypothetical protein GCM10027184_37960 [Saccharothrix stipae]
MLAVVGAGPRSYGFSAACATAPEVVRATVAIKIRARRDRGDLKDMIVLFPAVVRTWRRKSCVDCTYRFGVWPTTYSRVK